MLLLWLLLRFEDDKNVSSLYEDLWEENMTSERLTLQLYISEIVTLITEGIASSSWASKRKVISFIFTPCKFPFLFDDHKFHMVNTVALYVLCRQPKQL